MADICSGIGWSDALWEKVNTAVAEEFAKAKPELDHGKRASNREGGWSQLGACMVALYFMGRIYPLLAADSRVRTVFALGAVGAVIGVAHGVYKIIAGR